MSEHGNKIRKFANLRSAVGLIIIGLFFVAVSIWILASPKTEYVQAEGVIAQIEVEKINADETNYHVYVDYTVDGQEYKHVELGSYSSSMKEGDTVELEYDPADPGHIQSVGADKIPFITLAVGVIATVGGVLMLVKNAKKKATDFDEYDRVDMSAVTGEQVEEIRLSAESGERQRYFFHYAGKLNQGHVLEDMQKRPVYEAQIVKITALKPYQFDFVNHLTGSVKHMEIGHTVTVSTGIGSGFGYQVPISKSFTVNGVNNWDELASRGYSFSFSLKGLTTCFDVKHYGVSVAYIETTGTNTLRGKNSAIGNLPVNGLFNVECCSADVEDVFLVCMSIARAIFYED